MSVVWHFVKQGADINTRTEDGYTALMVAMAHKDKDLVNYILFRGGWVNVNLIDEAIDLAQEMGEWGIVYELIGDCV